MRATGELSAIGTTVRVAATDPAQIDTAMRLVATQLERLDAAIEAEAGRTIAEIFATDNVDGALVGGASLDAEEFASICRYRDHVGTL